VAVNVNGNETSAVQTITVNDVTPPTVEPLHDLSVECLGDAPVDVSQVIADDACTIALTITHVGDEVIGEACAAGQIIRTYQATDACGNTTDVTQVIIAEDNTPPSFPSPPATLRLSPNDPIPEIVEPEVTDDCDGEVTLTMEEKKTILDPDCPKEFNLVYLWTATDCSGNVARLRERIAVRDTDKPYFTNEELPMSFTGDLSLPCGSEIPEAAVLSAFDDCDGELQVTCSEEIEETAYPGQVTVTRTWEASDCSGNSVRHRQRISTIDRDQPVFDNRDDFPADISRRNAVSCDAMPAPPVITATDACDGPVQVMYEEEMRPRRNVDATQTTCPDDFVLVRTWTATDCAGKTVTYRQRISITDEEPPTVITPEPIATCAGETVFFPLPEVSDACDEEVDISVESETALTAEENGYSGSFPAGEHVVTIIATDHCGNETRVELTVTVTICDLSRSDNEQPEVATTSLLEFYPNPFEQRLMLNFTPKLDDKITVQCFDLTGQRIATMLIDEPVAAGSRYSIDISPPANTAVGLILVVVSGDHTSVRERILHTK